MTTQTATFTLPESHLPAAQAIVCQFAYLHTGTHLDEDIPMREIIETVETISALYTLGIPGEPIVDYNRDLDSLAVACLRKAAVDVNEMGLDMAVNAYDMNTVDGRERAAYKHHLALQAQSLLEILP